MTRKELTQYFLDKPGTFEDQEKNCISLNLASEKVVTLKNEYEIEIKLNKKFSKQIEKRFASVEHISLDGEFEWNKIKLDASVDINDLYELLDSSYEDIMNNLPQEEQDEVLDLEW